MAKNGTKTRKQGPRLSASLAVLWRSFCRDAFDPYRPELHYMRGPGPKWRAKHGVDEPGAEVPASPVPTQATPAAA
jgi:hypothetical protein